MEKDCKSIVAETGRMLIEKNLVARTWGNVSMRTDTAHFAITPSGLDYTNMTAADIAVIDMTDGTYEGTHKPSSEKGVHRAAYEVFPDAGFVIHTHQTYASAIGLAGFAQLAITGEEKAALGGIAIAGYGLSSTKKLTENVKRGFSSGAHVVLMPHHGVAICGKDRTETFERALLLEDICRRSTKGQPAQDAAAPADKAAEALLQKIHAVKPNARLVRTPAVMQISAAGEKLTAELDDMAQMMGRCIPVCTESEAEAMLEKHNAVFVPTIGGIVDAADASDAEALSILMDKACICRLHTKASGANAKLSLFDDVLMHTVYLMKYSKQK